MRRTAAGAICTRSNPSAAATTSSSVREHPSRSIIRICYEDHRFGRMDIQRFCINFSVDSILVSASMRSMQCSESAAAVIRNVGYFHDKVDQMLQHNGTDPVDRK